MWSPDKKSKAQGIKLIDQESTSRLSCKNNTLFTGQRGVGGQIRILIAGVGNLIGWEDMLKYRPNTTSATCISKTG